MLQPDHIYSPTPIYSNLADKVFMFGSSYHKILPVKSNASMSHIRSEKGNGGGVAFIGLWWGSVHGALWVLQLRSDHGSDWFRWFFEVFGHCSAAAKIYSAWQYLERYITNKHAFHAVYLNEFVQLDSLFTA